ncbi:MAG: hypothetical protein AB7I32_12990 [Gammaproteobacteria bacterium]
MLRLLGWLVLLACVGLIAVVLALPFALVDDVPRVEAGARLKPPQIARARALLAEHDPRRLRDGDVRALKLSADELGLVTNYVLAQLGGGASRVQIGPHVLEAIVTAQLPPNPVGRYVNVEIGLSETGAMPLVDRLRIGRLRVPSLFVNPLLAGALHLAHARAGLADPGSLLHGVEFGDDGIVVHYQWHTAIADAVRKQLVPTEDAVRLHEFHGVLVALTRQGTGALPLPQLLAPLFELAASRASTGDPQADNRALLVVLSSYLSGRRLDALVPGAAEWPSATRRSVRLHGRVDLAKHFVNSAALAATGGQAVAQTVGLFKELDDSRSGSGFSFIDLMADEAGTRFGKRATESRVMARALQPRAAIAFADADWMPAPVGLREHMSEAEFNRRYGGVDGPGYRKVLADINRRVDDVALYR